MAKQSYTPAHTPLFGFRPQGTVSKEERQQILARWDEARTAYRKESAAFTRVRQSLPPEGKRNQAQIVIFELARQRYKAACQLYYKERERMNYEMYQDRKAEAVQDIVQQLKDVMHGIPTFDVPTAAEIKEADRLRDAVNATGDFDTIRQAALQRSVLAEPGLGLTDEIMDMDTPADALVATQAEHPEARAAMPPSYSNDMAADASAAEDAAEQPEPDTPEALIQKYGIPEAPR